MQHSYSVIVKEVRRETPDCVSVAFDIPNELKEIFAYKPGQYINLIKNLHGQEIHRSYSLCSSPMDSEWRVAIKLLPGGAFSSYANNDLCAGEIIELMPPNGKFTTDVSQNINYLFIAAGSGITPCLSLIKSILLSSASSVRLIYGSKSTDQIIFLEQLQSLKNQYIDRLALYFVLSQEIMEEELFHGRISSDKLSEFNGKIYSPDSIDEVFICGPEQMIFDTRDALISQGFEESKIKFELFGTFGLPAPKVEAIKGAGERVQVRLKADGRTIHFDMSKGIDNILDAALKNNARLPYACKGGVCCTCKAKLIKGEVQLLRNYGLEPDEIENGYILTCQAIPKTDAIQVDFDQ
ncbi:MAG: 2Fe-2S iron-sulfur cluster binding domain-containing protein [Saprospiraceae bacterium]|nr:2Fe-2S iron-sulfur cluster binding domain-containing protein [Saprospiraceae bacterium]